MGRKPQIAKAPYASKGWLENFFQLIRRVRLTEVTRKLVNQYSLTAPGNESKLVAALRFIQLIDEKGKIDEEEMKGLRMEGDPFKASMTNLMQRAYSEVFQTLDIQKATIADLQNFFVGRYNYSKRQAEGAAILFAYLCEKASISLSPEISDLNKRGVRSVGSRKIRKVGKTEDAMKNNKASVTSVEEIQSIPLNEVEQGGYTIIVRGENFSLNKILKTKDDLDLFIQILKLGCKFKE